MVSISFCIASQLLTCYSTLCTESRHWGFSIRSICLHPGHAPILSTLARGMGLALIHVGLQYDYRRIKYHRMGSVYRHIYRSYPCCDNLVDLSRQCFRFSILRLARQFALLLYHYRKRQWAVRTVYYAHIQSLLLVCVQLEGTGRRR